MLLCERVGIMRYRVADSRLEAYTGSAAWIARHRVPGW